MACSWATEMSLSINNTNRHPAHALQTDLHCTFVSAALTSQCAGVSATAAVAFHARKCAASHDSCTGGEAIVRWIWYAGQPRSIVHLGMAQMAPLICEKHRKDQLTLMHA